MPDVGSDGGADAGAGSIEIIAPAASPTYTNGEVAVQLSFEPATAVPSKVELLKDGTLLAALAPPYAFSWDTTEVGEGSYVLTASALIADRVVTSPAVTIIVDRTPPTVIASQSVPAPGASNVALGDPIQVVFSEPIASSSMSNAVVVAQPAGPLATTATWDSGSAKVSLSLSDPSTVVLSAASATTFTATAADTVKDLAGNAIANPPRWTWTVPLWLDLGSVPGQSPSLALDPNGTPFISTASKLDVLGLHTHELAVSKYVAKAPWDRISGSPQTSGATITDPTTSVAIGTDGQPTLAWSEQGANETATSIHVAHWTGKAWDTTFTPLNQSSGGGVAAFLPCLAMGKSGAMSVAWAGATETSANGISIATWTGQEWALLPSPAGDGATSPTLLLRTDDDPVAAWVAGASLAGVSMWNGQGWQTNNYPSAVSSSLALTSLDRPLVAYVNGNAITVQYVDTGDPEYATQLATGNQPAGPRIAVDSADHVVVVWTDFNGSSRDVEVGRWTGTEWDTSYGPLSAISTTGSDAANPVISLDSSGAIVVAWEETGPEGSATYVRKSNR